jgi:hypothetical protein
MVPQWEQRGENKSLKTHELVAFIQVSARDVLVAALGVEQAALTN